MPSALVRRQELLDRLMIRRCDTIDNLANEFHVNERTIRRDISILSHEYPIAAIRGKGGGVRVQEGYRIRHALLSELQIEFLVRISETLTGADRASMEEILRILRNT